MHDAGSEAHTHIVELPHETEGLPEARKTALVELADGDEFELEIIPVKNRSAMPRYGCSPTTAPSPGRR
jgi:hypothetical protein